nr:MFS transporter [Paracoccus sp. S-4012]
MTIGLAALTAGYVLSQFYRAFLAVLAPTLEAELGATPGDLAISSGMWFIAFAAAQLPIGRALDRAGPRWTASGLLGLGGAGGAAVFALATAPWHLHVAMALIGVGCAPVLMGAYYLLARAWPPERFAALGGAVVGIGSLGNILGASPLVATIEILGWRETLWWLAAVTLAISAVIAAVVRDPPRAHGDRPAGNLGELLRLRGLWPILPILFVGYAASAAIRGVWAAPYLETVYGASEALIGQGAMVMGLAMVAGNFLVGPAIRLAGTPRRAVIVGSIGAIAALVVLWLAPDAGLGAAFVLLAVLGLSGMNYALVIAHGRAFLPPHLLGLGMTFLNMVSIAGVGVLQFASRPVYGAAMAEAGPVAAISQVFLLFLVPLVVGFCLYLLSRERPDGP